MNRDVCEHFNPVDLPCDKCKQPEALRLADALQQQAVWEGHYGPSYLRDLLPEAAAKLRQLHEANEAFGKRQEWWNERMFVLEQQRDALLAALKLIQHATSPTPNDGGQHEAAHDIASAAIAKAEENT